MQTIIQMEQYKVMRKFFPFLLVTLLTPVCQSCEEDRATAWDDTCGIYSNYEDDANANLTVTYNGQEATNKEVYVERPEMSSIEEYINNSLLYNITLRNVTSIDNLTFHNAAATSTDAEKYFNGDTIIDGKEISFHATITISYGSSSPGGRSASSMVLDVTETAIQ